MSEHTHIGKSSNTTSSNQVQLGGSATTYAYGAVQEVNLKCEQLQRELDVFRNNI